MSSAGAFGESDRQRHGRAVRRDRARREHGRDPAARRRPCLALALAALATAPCVAQAGGEGGGEEKEPQGEREAAVEAASGRGVTFSVGDEFSLWFVNTLQPGWFYVDRERGNDTNTFALLRLRTLLTGHVWDESKTYFVQFDWAFDDPLFDAWFNWNFWESADDDHEIGVRGGLQKPHFGREFQGSFIGLEQTTRPGVTPVFTGFRVLGAYLHGHHLPGRKLHWWAGVVNDDPAIFSSAAEGGQNGARNVDNRLSYVFDARFDPAGDFGDEAYIETDLGHSEEVHGTIGGSALLGNFRAGSAAGPEVTTRAWHGYTAWKYQGFDVMAEVFSRRDDQQGGPTSDALGWQVGGSYAFAPFTEGGGQLGIAARVSRVNLEDSPVLLTRTALGDEPGTITDFDATLSWYVHRHMTKVQLGYRHRDIDPDTGSASVNSLVDLLFTVRF